MIFFFFQAEDGIRDHCVTGVQTCALPISSGASRCVPSVTNPRAPDVPNVAKVAARDAVDITAEISEHGTAAATRSRAPSGRPTTVRQWIARPWIARAAIDRASIGPPAIDRANTDAPTAGAAVDATTAVVRAKNAT